MAAAAPSYLFDGIDNESAAMILRLQLLDIQEHENGLNDETVNSRSADNDAAFREQMRVLTIEASTLRDRGLALAMHARQNGPLRRGNPNPVPGDVAAPRAAATPAQRPVIRPAAVPVTRATPQPVPAHPVIPSTPAIQITVQPLHDLGTVEILPSPSPQPRSHSPAAGTSTITVAPTTNSPRVLTATPALQNVTSTTIGTSHRVHSPVVSLSGSSSSSATRIAVVATREIATTLENENTGRSTTEKTTSNLSHSNEEEDEDAAPTGLSNVAKGKQKAVEVDDSTTDALDIVDGALLGSGPFPDAPWDDFIEITDDEAEAEDLEIVAESSQWAAARKHKKRTKKIARRRCISCEDMVVTALLYRAVCNHDYCGDCLLNLFNFSFVDETLFPPRCCQVTINPEDEEVARFLTSAAISNYRDKKLEFETTNRTYCSDTACATFIRRENINGDRGRCSKCSKETCVLCKAPSHEGICAADTATQKVVQLLKDEGSQRCSECGHGVQITHGCNHMKCRCTAEWCYLCGKKWKTCSCKLFTEHHLLLRANELVDRAGPLAGAARAGAVAAAAENIRAAGHCDHRARAWAFRRGAGRCENCTQELTIFLMQCGSCPTVWCSNCARTRL